MHGKKDTLPIADILSEDQLDSWDDQIDPFEYRHLPTSVEAVPIEEADIQRAFAQADTHIISNAPVPPSSPTRPPRGLVARWRVLPSRRRFFVLLTLLVVLLLIVDGTLFLLNITRPHPSTLLSGAPTRPMLTVTPVDTHPGETVTLHIDGFSPSAQVLLTRDMQQAVRTDSGTSLIKLGRDGHADIHVLVEDSWGAGARLLLAEDTSSHYIASGSLEVTSDFPAPLPHLLVGTLDQPDGLKGPLGFGADVPEVNTLQSLLLRNTGGSWISWQATSSQPWLTLAPQQGVFQDSQGVFVAAARANLAPGYHQGTITITSNAGKPIIIQAQVTVLPPPKATSALLVVEPPLLSFTATDGTSGPTPQYLTISNPGVRPLNWSLTTSVPQDSLTQNLNENGQDTGAWLHTDNASGIVMPGASARIRVMAQSQQLLPGVYGGILLFTVNGNPLVALQPVAVALTVHLTFIATLLQSNPPAQTLALSVSGNCPLPVSWVTSVDAASQGWLHLAATSGVTSKGGATLVVQVNTNGKLLGTYTGQITLTASNHSGVATQGSPTAISVTLTVVL